MNAVIKGIAASDGIAIGPAYRLETPTLSVTTVTGVTPSDEINRLQIALDASIHDVETIKARATKNLSADSAQVFDVQLAILQDPDFLGEVRQVITEQQINAEAALTKIALRYRQELLELKDNPYMREREADVADVTRRVVGHLRGVGPTDPALLDHPVVVVAPDLGPSEAMTFDPAFVLGFVVQSGGQTSHSAIIARSLGIPAVVGVPDTSTIAAQTTVIVDGTAGQVIVDPDATTVQATHAAQARQAQQRKQLASLVDKRSVTADGRAVQIAANISRLQDLPAVLQAGAEGIGLFRTEFLYMDTDEPPSEDQQVRVYQQVLTQMGSRPVVVRTADIGGDKPVPYLDQTAELNPFMGYRGIRMSLGDQSLFRTQLRALLRASSAGNLSIMFPMIATIEELRQAKTIYAEERSRLTEAGVAVGPVKIGMMVEVPAAAVLADRFAPEVDFMSIGTNDLIGYGMAADRTNQRVGYLYQPYNPAILRLINTVIKAGHQAGIPVAMCGEMAGDPVAVPILLGMGLDEFSMSAAGVLPTRQQLLGLSQTEMRHLADDVLTMASTPDRVKGLVAAATEANQQNS